MARTKTYPGSSGLNSVGSAPAVKASSGSYKQRMSRPISNAKPMKRKTRVRNTKPSAQAENVHVGFAFVVLTGADPKHQCWQYVHVSYGTTLDTNSAPYKVFPHISREMGEFWKRVVIDNAYDWENYNHVHPKTLKLVEVYHHTQDVSDRLFYSDEEMENQQKLAALSKLTAEDAKRLGVDRDYFMLKMFQQGTQERMDENRASAMRDQQVELEVKPYPLKKPE